ncbi:unnamed protein product, partial [Vitis vinifera]
MVMAPLETEQDSKVRGAFLYWGLVRVLKLFGNHVQLQERHMVRHFWSTTNLISRPRFEREREMSKVDVV